jgi:hypothetical protein
VAELVPWLQAEDGWRLMTARIRKPRLGMRYMATPST